MEFHCTSECAGKTRFQRLLFWHRFSPWFRHYRNETNKNLFRCVCACLLTRTREFLSSLQARENDSRGAHCQRTKKGIFAMHFKSMCGSRRRIFDGIKHLGKTSEGRDNAMTTESNSIQFFFFFWQRADCATVLHLVMPSFIFQLHQCISSERMCWVCAHICFAINKNVSSSVSLLFVILKKFFGIKSNNWMHSIDARWSRRFISSFFAAFIVLNCQAHKRHQIHVSLHRINLQNTEKYKILKGNCWRERVRTRATNSQRAFKVKIRRKGKREREKRRKAKNRTISWS